MASISKLQRQSILNALVRWRDSIAAGAPSSNASCYCFGSLVYRGGKDFDLESSDVDLVVVEGSRSTTEARLQLLHSVLEATRILEQFLAKTLRRFSLDDPITSAIVVSQFEVLADIHKSNERPFFGTTSFSELLSVGTEGALNPPVALATSPDENEPLPSIRQVLASVQRHRNAYLSISPSGSRFVRPHNDERLALPKDLCRKAAVLRHCEFQLEDDSFADIKAGFSYMLALIEDAGSHDLKKRLAGSLMKHGYLEYLDIDHILECWELLAERAQQLHVGTLDRSPALSDVPSITVHAPALPAKVKPVSQFLIPRLYIHFIDHYFLESLGTDAVPDECQREARLAFRLAVGLSAEVIIAASSFIESDLCRNIVDEVGFAHNSGRVRVVGNGTSFWDYCARASTLYDAGSERSARYVSARGEIPLPFVDRQRSATADIIEAWRQRDGRRTARLLREIEHAAGRPMADHEWDSLPERLAGQAFIAANVEKLLPVTMPSPQSLRNELLAWINEAYFSSLAREFACGGVIDLVYLGAAATFTPFGPSLSYHNAIQGLERAGKLTEFQQISMADFATNSILSKYSFLADEGVIVEWTP